MTTPTAHQTVAEMLSTAAHGAELAEAQARFAAAEAAHNEYAEGEAPEAVQAEWEAAWDALEDLQIEQIVRDGVARRA